MHKRAGKQKNNNKKEKEKKKKNDNDNSSRSSKQWGRAVKWEIIAIICDGERVVGYWMDGWLVGWLAQTLRCCNEVL